MIQSKNGPVLDSDTVGISTVQEFNLWCALHSKPFTLVQHTWPDGAIEWDIEAFSGRTDAVVAYGTGQREELQAVLVAVAFLAGIEWAERIGSARPLPETTAAWDERPEPPPAAAPEPDPEPARAETPAEPPAPEPEPEPCAAATPAPVLPPPVQPASPEPSAAAPPPAGTGAGSAAGPIPPVLRAALLSAALEAARPGLSELKGGPVAPGPVIPGPLRVGPFRLPSMDPARTATARAALTEPPLQPSPAPLPTPAAKAEPATEPPPEPVIEIDAPTEAAEPEAAEPEIAGPEATGPEIAAPETGTNLDPVPAEPVFPHVPTTSVPLTPEAPFIPPLPVTVERAGSADDGASYSLPALSLLKTAPGAANPVDDESGMTQNARALETVLRNFGVRGEIMEVRPGPVVTLYELEPAPGTKSSRVINLADDIARSMRAMNVRIAVVPGRSVIGIELPNPTRETVYLREMLNAEAYALSGARLSLALGKDIGGAPVVVDLARMPHLLIAGTTGSGKSVAINTMILSLVYRLPPEKCRFIMVDPKMLELSVYDGIPHLLTPVVTDPKKAIAALKWAVREMENRYRAMAHFGVRNIEGYNARVEELLRTGETMTKQVKVGYDKTAKQPIFEEQPMELATLPYIVVVVDEMADLMLVAGKEIEAAIQRLAQMARAAGIHLIMATQRPSVDVITGTIKANFPTRISFQVTSKIDSRTILGEAGAEQLLGQGDMLYMVGGGRITRVHGPFVSDAEVEDVVRHLKNGGVPDYLHSITEDDEIDGFEGQQAHPAGDDPPAFTGTEDEIYDQAVSIVLRERKCTVSFIQRCLQIGYNRAAKLVERMESEGVVSAANHVGKREVLGRNDYAANE